MPELPEVETNARNLRAWTVGRRIVAVTPPPGRREAGGLTPRAFAARLRGRRVEAVDRRGKWTLVRLSGGAGLGLHLGMSGKYARLAAGQALLPRFTRAVFALDDGTRVCFVDARRFGRLIAAARYDALCARPEIASLGPDALAATSPAHLRAALAATTRSVKEAIMDQRVLAGVGNLYATEALWRARLHPAVPAPAVAADAAALRGLARAIPAALAHGLRLLRAATRAGARAAVPPEYLEEGAPNPYFAYDRAGEPCPRCRTPFQALTLGGRTSVFCPRCQPPPRRKP
ncbi:MAG TPA: DNA-formamidopyrimidine glycosylase family protein [Myxococcota bacterium]|jgi:formamidopyrimidine-DNA glycosylase|nr:DNA-formamidopyrimidine glycosylase family protein [Myxococcota bacterium]